jgi:diguanylate cyclase (GGDEF)-like protein
MEDTQPASLRLQQLRLYVDSNLHDRYLAPILVLLVAALLTSWVPVWQVVLWAGLELVVIAVYISVYLRFLRAAPGPHDEARWTRRIALAHGAHMAMWSSIVVWAYAPGNLNSLMFVMLVHVGLISLTVATSSQHRQLLLLDMVAPAVALLAPPLHDGTLFSLGLTVAGMFYILLVLMVGLRIHASTAESLLLRLRNDELIRELEQQVRRDGLTGLGNRNHFVATGCMELERAARYQHSLALLMVDIDHFKKINDTCGHLAGDEALKAVSRVCEEMVRTTDCLARLGGEEFAVLIPQTALDQASAVAERLRAAVAGLRCDLQGSVVTLTVSIGVAIAEKSGEDLSSLMQRADLAMYEAKSKGRNCVVVAPGRAAKLVA